MISVPNIIKDWKDTIGFYKKESETGKLIRDTITVLELLEAPLSEQDKADLDAIHRIRSGSLKKIVCREYAMYNGDWYREHPWNVPKEKEPYLITPEEFFNHPDRSEQGCLPLWFEEKNGKQGWCFVYYLAGNPDDDKRYWTARPTDAQRKAVKWDG